MKFLKDVRIRIYHYAALQTEKDCKAMAFAIASMPTKEEQEISVGTLEKIAGDKCTFQQKLPYGEITLRHFSFMQIIRSIFNRGTYLAVLQ